MSTIQVCLHCEEICSEGNKYCRYCKTPEQRREMDENNRSINPNFKCKICDKEI